MKKPRTLFIVLMIISLVSSTLAQTSREYAVEDLAQFETDLAAGTYDEYILTTSGGVYDLTTYFNIPANTVIKAAEGLAEKPVIMRTNNTSAGAGIFRVQNVTINIVLEGLIFDGTVTGDNKAVGLRAESTVHVHVNNCVFRNFTDTNGVFRLQGALSSIDVRNSVFHDNKERMIQLFTPDAVYGHVNIDNCLFYNISGTIVMYRSASGVTAIGTTLTVNHSTFNNITVTTDGLFRGRDNNSGEAKILNSVFTNITEGRPLTAGLKNLVVDYCYIGAVSVGSATHNPEVTNLLTTAPVYEDAENFNFKITNADDFIAGTGDVAGVVWYYAPRVHPDLLVENDTKVKVVFSRPVDQASAEITTNYALSGTFGLTGNPAAAVLITDLEVLLTVGDISNVPLDETIIVTVTGVTDTYGLVVGDNNTATYTSSIVIEPEKYLVTFTVTFDDAGTPAAVEGAQITITGITGALTTNAEGVATIELESGTYTYSVEATGYEIASDLQFIVEDASLDVPVTLVIIPIPEETVLTMVPQVVSNRANQSVTGTSNKTGFIVIVKEDAPQETLAEILAAAGTNLGASADVITAGEMVSISAAGLQPGIYNGYAVDTDDNISDAVLAVVTVNDPHSREYTVDQIAQLQTDLATGAYNEYILTTSGGIYDLTDSNITIGANAVIKAAEGLSEKPIIMRTNNTTADAGIFRTQTLTINLGLEGLIFDGTVTSETANQKVMGLRAESTVHVNVNNCVFRNFTNINGVFRLQGAESSMDMRNSVFHDITQRVVQPWQVDVTYGHINIDNCLFYNINGAVVWYRSTGGGANLAIGSTLTVNHSTFHNINTNADGVFRGRDNNTGEVKILNSVFTNVADTRPLTNGIKNLTVDYCYLGNTAVGSAANDPLVNNLFITAPVYEDAANLVFRITNADEFLVASGDIAGVTWYYPPRVNPDLIIEDATHVKVVFNRPVELTSAENTSNYTLSGTFGLTGNPTSAQLVNEREVLLAVGDISSISDGLSIIVTVTVVADTYGMVVGDNNVATYVATIPVDLEVFTESQTVSNADGQFVLVQSSFPDGYVYIVLEDVPQATKEQLDAAVAAGEGAFAEVTAAMVDIEISAFNLHPGTYYAYAVSMDGELSASSTNSIIITDGIPPVVSNEVQTAANGPDDFVYVQSNKDNGRVYIVIADFVISTPADLDAAVAANQGSYAEVTAANTNMQVSTSGLEPAVYFAFAIDAAGNISGPGTNPITIEQLDTSTEDILSDQISVFSSNNTIYVRAPLSLHGTGYEVFGVSGRKIYAGLLDGDTQIKTEMSGIYIVSILSGLHGPVKVFVGW